MKVVSFIIEWWPIILILVGVISIAISKWYFYSKKTEEEKKAILAAQIENVRKWLLYAVTLAENDLGSGTGQLKLPKVYDLFVSKFPMLVSIVSFQMFSDLVDEALGEMKSMLNKNDKIKTMVENKEVS